MPKCYSSVKGEITLAGNDYITKNYTEWAYYNNYFDYKISYDITTIGNESVKNKLGMDFDYWFRGGWFTEVNYRQDFAKEVKDFSTITSLCYTRILKKDIWNLDIGAGVKYNLINIYPNFFVRNTTQFKLFGLVKITDTILFNVPIGSYMTFNNKAKLSVNVIDFTGISNFKTNIELTNIEILEEGSLISENRGGLAFEF
jgi:hypothetical protein